MIAKNGEKADHDHECDEGIASIKRYMFVSSTEMDVIVTYIFDALFL